MAFIYVFTICFSIMMFLILFANAFRRRTVAGAVPLMLQIAGMIIWAAGSLLEYQASYILNKILWRNISQIGLYTIPVSCVWFSVEYGGFHRLRKLLPALAVVPLIGIMLLFNDDQSHIMRYGYAIVNNPWMGNVLSAAPTVTGMIFHSYNYCLVFLSLILLGVLAMRVAKRQRIQVMLIMVAIAMLQVASFVQTALLEQASISFPITILYLPSGLILFYNLYHHDMLMASPIAREKIFDVIEQGIVVTNNAGMIVDINPYAAKLFEAFLDVATKPIGQNVETALVAYPQWIELTRQSQIGEMEVKSDLENAANHYFRIKIYPLLSVGNKSFGSVTIIRDITARRLHELALESKADTDGLTGLLNRSGFVESAEELLAAAKESNQPATMLMMDMDRFKQINDTFGHIYGDKALVRFSEILKKTLRQQDVIGRIGGDEFAALLPSVSSDQGLIVAERIREKVEKQEIRLEDGGCIHITISVGVCDNCCPDETPDNMIDCADKAMYRAKQLSRNRSVVWNSELDHGLCGSESRNTTPSSAARSTA